MGNHPDEYPAWELAMLRCDRTPAERGSILWYHPKLHMDLRLCLHHSKVHADPLREQGFIRLFTEDEEAA